MDYRSGQHNAGTRDPAAFLWNQLVSGEPILLGIDAFRSPIVRIKDQILNAAFRNTFDRKGESYFMLGNVQLVPEGDGIAVVIDQFCTDAVTSPNSCRIEVPYKFEKGQSLERTASKEEHLTRIEKFHEDWVRQDLELGANIESAISLILTARTKGPSCSVVVDVLAVDFPLRVVPLFAIPVIRNAIYESLRLSQNTFPDFGFITLCGERLCLFAKNRLKETDLNFIGIWVSGVHSIHHPYVWLVGSQFLSNTSIASRLCDIFLIALFFTPSSSVPGQPLFYNCICPNPSKPRYQLWKGSATTSVSRVPTTTNKVITVSLEKLAAGKSSENFERAVEEFATKCTIDVKRNMQHLPQKDCPPTSHGMWPSPPVPIGNIAVNTKPTVPDVSFYGSLPYYQQNNSQQPALFPSEATDFSQRSTVPLLSPTEQNFGPGFPSEKLQYQTTPFNYPPVQQQFPAYTPNHPAPPQHALQTANSSSSPHFPGTVSTVGAANSPPAFHPLSGQNGSQFSACNNGALLQNGSPVQSQPPVGIPCERLPSTGSDGSPGTSPEVYELIRRQDQQLSELKMQIQLLLDAQRSKNSSEGGILGEQNGSPRLSERPQSGGVRERRLLNASDASTMTETPYSPPVRQPLLFDIGTQMDNLVQGSQCTFCGRCSPPRMSNDVSPQMPNGRYEPPGQDEEAYTLFFPEKAQKNKDLWGAADAFQADQHGHSTAVKKRGQAAVRQGDPCSAISMDNYKGRTNGSPVRRFELSQHTVSFCNEISVLGKAGPHGDSTAKSTLETFIHPRLTYQTLNLNESSMYRGSGNDLSFQVNCIAQKYCPSAKDCGAAQTSPVAFGERKKKGSQGNGLLKQVLEQEAQRRAGKEMVPTYVESNTVSFATREYLKNYGLLDDKPRSSRSNDQDDNVEDHVLDISELKKLPKLL